MFEMGLGHSLVIVILLYLSLVVVIKFGQWANSGPYSNSPTTHDFTNKKYIFSKVHIRHVDDGGLILIQCASNVFPEDFILLDNGRSTTRYKIISKTIEGLPTDLLQARIVFAPRFLNFDKPIKID